MHKNVNEATVFYAVRVNEPEGRQFQIAGFEHQLILDKY